MNAMKLAIPLFVALAYGPAQGLATPILSAELASFAVLAQTGVTTDPAPSTIGGNLGSITPSLTGTYNILSPGSQQSNTPLAQQAQLDLDDAIVALNNMTATSTLGAALTGTIMPGIYDVAAGLVTGDLILNGGGSDTAVWVFRFSSTLTTAVGSNVTVQNVGDGSNVGIYWTTVAATLNGNTFAGNVLANTLISSNGDSDGVGIDSALTIGCGRLLSAGTQVTLIGDSISTGCAGIGSGSNGFDQGTFDQVTFATHAPEPEIYAMMASGLGLMGWVARRRKQKAA